MRRMESSTVAKYEYCWISSDVSSMNSLGKQGWRVVPGLMKPATTAGVRVLMEREIVEFTPIPRGGA